VKTMQFRDGHCKISEPILGYPASIIRSVLGNVVTNLSRKNKNPKKFVHIHYTGTWRSLRRFLEPIGEVTGAFSSPEAQLGRLTSFGIGRECYSRFVVPLVSFRCCFYHTVLPCFILYFRETFLRDDCNQ